MIGNKIKKLRKNKNMSQESLAQMLFVSDKTISSWENERVEPSIEFIIKLCNIFECNPSYLLYDDINKFNLETEIRIKLTKNEFNSLNELMKKDAVYLNKSVQEDTYYQPTYRKFLKDNCDDIKEWLRIGKRGNKFILNYKNWYDNTYCDEYEVEIDNYNNLDKIFSILGLEKIVTVNKERIKYSYLNKYIVSLDYVKTLGYFIEIEVKKYDENPLEEYDSLLKIVKSLNLDLDNIDKRGYPYHLIYDNR